ncbi:unnamed protein product, partial [Prorocentrum cordatum]
NWKAHVPTCFAHRLRQRRFGESADLPNPTSTPIYDILLLFVVAEKSGPQRLIFDARVCYTRFKPPPCAELPSGSAFARAETQGSGDSWFSSGDISNAFYTMPVTEDLCEFFSLPLVRAGLVGVSQLGGVATSAPSWLLPELAIPPIGWSWSLRVCKCAPEAALSWARIAPAQQVRDRSRGVVLGPKPPAAGATYAGNYLVAGSQRPKTQAAASKVERELSSLGYVVHDQVEATRATSFAGLELDGHRDSARISARRAWRSRHAIEKFLRRPKVRGPFLETVVGHWVMLLKRCSLAIFGAACAFILASPPRGCRFGPRRGANCGRSRPAPASTPWGVLTLLRDPGRPPSDEAKDWDKSFGEVDPAPFTREGLAIARAFPGTDSFAICRAEGLAVAPALRPQLRAADAFGKRIACLVDNMSLALAIGNGRAARPLMPTGRAPQLLPAPLAAGEGILTAPVPQSAAARQRGPLLGSLLIGFACLGQLADYQRRAGAFIGWCSQPHPDWDNWEQLDTTMATYFDHLYFLAALKFFLPPIGRRGDQTLRRAFRSLAKRGKCAPRRMRAPLPWSLAAALPGAMLHRGQVRQTIAMIMSFASHLRPPECDPLTATQVAPPSR